jgi:predicted HTH transcriptional regulator
MKISGLLLFITFILVGCGDSSKEIEDLQKSESFLQKQLKQQAIQITELTSKLDAQDKKMKEVDYSIERLNQKSNQLHNLMEKVRKKAYAPQNQNTAPEMTEAQRSRKALINAQQRKMVHQLVRGMATTRKPEEIANMLNLRKLKDHNNQEWTKQSVDLYMRKNSFGPYAKKR